MKNIKPTALKSVEKSSENSPTNAVETATENTALSILTKQINDETLPPLVALDSAVDPLASTPCFDIEDLPKLEAIASSAYDVDYLIGAPTPSPSGQRMGSVYRIPRDQAPLVDYVIGATPSPSGQKTGSVYRIPRNQAPLEPHLVELLAKKSDCLNTLARSNQAQDAPAMGQPVTRSWTTTASIGTACLVIMGGIFACRKLFSTVQPTQQQQQPVQGDSQLAASNP